VPPYKEGDIAPLQCYHPNCKFKGDYAHMLEHVRSRHGQSRNSLLGTYLHTKGLVEIMSQQEKRRALKKEQKPAKARVNGRTRPAQIVAAASETKAAAAAAAAAPAKRDIVREEREGHEAPRELVSSSSSSANPLEMLSTIFQFVQGKQQEQKWKETLPTVTIKVDYLEKEGPPAKGDGVNRADWPRHLHADFVQHPGFAEYLAEHKNKIGGNGKKTFNGVGRLLGFLEVTPHPSKPDLQVTDVEVLVALRTSGNHLKIMRSPLLGPQYGWASEAMSALAHYCTYHSRELTNRMATEDTAHFAAYKSVLRSLVDDLNRGYRKRCAESRATSMRKKQADDLKLLKQTDVPTMQAAILEGYIALAAIEKRYGNRPLDKKTRGRANACLAGGIALDTFPGRKMEWEALVYQYVMSVLNSHGDHLVCSDHKTAQTYGSIAKLLTSGLFLAFLCYSRLHRPGGCETFLVPATQGAPRVCLPTALRAWCSSHLGAGAPVWPTYNLVRKLFHRALHLLTEDKEKMKELMVVLDAHSKKVQGVHYILRDPSDDVVLAKQLVKSVLGETVVWPSAQQVEEHLRSHEVPDEEDLGEDDVNDEPDEELPYFAGAEIFGVRVEVLTPLLDLQHEDGTEVGSLVEEASAEQQLVVADVSAGPEAPSKTKSKETGKKKKKKKKEQQTKKNKKKKKDEKQVAQEEDAFYVKVTGIMGDVSPR